MRAFYLSEQTPLDALALSEDDQPVPRPGEALIRLKAAALNHRDLWILTGPVGSPGILGSDGSGVIESVGESTAMPVGGGEVVINPSLHWGPREDAYDGRTWSILGLPADGTFAEYITVPVSHVYPKPAHLTFEEAAALPLAGLTAYRALVPQGGLEPGERVLIHAIGGGVAIFALQFAVALGARVMVTSTQDWKLERARQLGAECAINSKSDDWVERAKEWSDGKGVDLVVDSLGGDYLARSLEALRLGGRVVNFGRTASGDATINVRLLFWNQLRIIGATMGSPSDFAGMLALVTQHLIHPVIDRVCSLEQIGEAAAAMQRADQFGKIVLTID